MGKSEKETDSDALCQMRTSRPLMADETLKTRETSQRMLTRPLSACPSEICRVVAVMLEKKVAMVVTAVICSAVFFRCSSILGSAVQEAVLS